MNRMDLNSKHSCDFSYHNITRSQISIDKYNGESKRINIPEKISGQQHNLSSLRPYEIRQQNKLMH